jgi:hypothetical protein
MPFDPSNIAGLLQSLQGLGKLGQGRRPPPPGLGRGPGPMGPMGQHGEPGMGGGGLGGGGLDGILQQIMSGSHSEPSGGMTPNGPASGEMNTIAPNGSPVPPALGGPPGGPPGGGMPPPGAPPGAPAGLAGPVGSPPAMPAGAQFGTGLPEGYKVTQPTVGLAGTEYANLGMGDPPAGGVGTGLQMPPGGFKFPSPTAATPATGNPLQPPNMDFGGPGQANSPLEAAMQQAAAQQGGAPAPSLEEALAAIGGDPTLAGQLPGG